MCEPTLHFDFKISGIGYNTNCLNSSNLYRPVRFLKNYKAKDDKTYRSFYWIKNYNLSYWQQWQLMAPGEDFHIFICCTYFY